MTCEQFIAIAKGLSVDIYAPNDASISFFNSPFPAHRASKAVDIYPANAKFGDVALSPIEGTVKAIHEYSSPNLYPDKQPLSEYLVLFECITNPEVNVKIIHLCPSVRVGDEIKVGDKIGTFIRSGYYPFWVDPHLHVELRDQRDAVRAGGGYPLKVWHEKQAKKSGLKPAPEGNLSGTVTHVGSRYTVIRLSNDAWGNIGYFSGLKVSVGSSVGIVDGGIPYIGYGGVLVDQEVKVGQHVSLAGTRIGEVTSVFKNISKFRVYSFKVMVGDCEYMGVSLKLNLQSNREINLIPLKMDPVNLRGSHEISIKKVSK